MQRYVCWSAYILKKHPKLESKLGSFDSHENENNSGGGGPTTLEYTAKLPLDQKLYFHYSVQDDTDEGVLMNTKINLSEVSNGRLHLLGAWI